MISTDALPSWRLWLPIVAATLCSREVCAAARSIDQHQPADPAGSVDIVDVAGSVLVSGWDRPEVAVSGVMGDLVERVELTSSGIRTTVRVLVPDGSHWGGDSSAKLTIHVPAHSALNLSSVSADLTLRGVSGPQPIRTVSGDIDR